MVGLIAEVLVVLAVAAPLVVAAIGSAGWRRIAALLGAIAVLGGGSALIAYNQHEKSQTIHEIQNAGS